MTQLGMGAEAIVTRTPEGVLKRRLKKSYRHPHIDNELRVSRTRHEARILERAKLAGVPVPTVKTVDESTLLLEEIPALLELFEEGDQLLAFVLGKIVEVEQLFDFL